MQEKGIELVLVRIPIKYTIDTVAAMDDRKDIEVYLFAGEEDVSLRFSEVGLKRNMPKLMADGRVKVEPTTVIMGGAERVSGTRMRRAIELTDLKSFNKLTILIFMKLIHILTLHLKIKL